MAVFVSFTQCFASKAAVQQLDLLCKQRTRMVGSYHLCLQPGSNEVAVYNTAPEKPSYAGGFRPDNRSIIFTKVIYDAPVSLTAISTDFQHFKVDLAMFLDPSALHKIHLLHATQDTPCASFDNMLSGGPLSPTPSTSVLRAHGLELPISCHENDLVCKMVDEYGVYANETLSQVALLAEPGLVVDVGTHVGIVSVVAAALGHDVIGVEAATISVRRLQHNVAALKLQERVTILPVAAGRAYGCARHSVGWHMEGGTQNYGASSMMQWQDTAQGANSHFEHVLVAPLDDLLPNERTINLMKMDIEGSECHALLGLRRVFAERRVQQLVVEVNSAALAGAGCSYNGLQHILRSFCMDAQLSAFNIILGDVSVLPQSEACVVPQLVDIENSLVAVLGSKLP